MGSKKMTDSVPAAQADEARTSYSEDIARIQEIVGMLQQGCEIDSMLALVKEAACLIERCQCKLARTDIEITEALRPLESEDRTNA